MKATRILAALLAAILMLALAIPAMAEEEEEITLIWVGAGWNQNDKSAKIIEKWNAIHPNIHVEYQDKGTLVDDAYKTNLDSMIADGVTVDITYLTTADVYRRVLAGGALPLDEYIAAAGDDFVDMYGTMTTALLSYDGQVYGVPYAGNTFKVFYNKDMVAAKGIEIPETWSLEEFTEIAKQLNDPENGIYGVTFPYAWIDIVYAPANLSGWDMVKYDDDGNIVPCFDDQLFKDVMAAAKALADDYQVAPSLATIMAESINRRQTLMTGKAAMIVDGPYTLVWMQNYMFNDPGEGPMDFELGVADLPYATEDGIGVSYNTVAGAFYIPKTSAHPAEAYEFEKFLCNECMQESACYMPIYKDADMEAATKSFTEFVDSNGELHTDVYPLDTAIAAVATPYESYIGKYNLDPSLASAKSAVYDIFDNNIALYLNGEMDLDAWCAEMQQLSIEAIEELAED